MVWRPCARRGEFENRASPENSQMGKSKSKRVVRVVKKAVRGVVRKTKRAGKALMGLDGPARAAANMLIDPCNSTLAPSVYRGDQGFRARFISNNTVATGAGLTNGVVVFIPGTNQLYVLENASVNTAVPWVTLSTFAPGAAFLTGNAKSIRCLGACLSSTPISANLATSGQCYTALVPVDALTLSSSTQIQSIVQLCNAYGKVSIDSPMETRWMPGADDETYINVGTSDSTLADNLAIVQCFVGLPAATGVTYRMTTILEWKPLQGIGLVSESFLSSPSRNTIEHVKEAIRQRNPHWWTNVGSAAYSVVRGYATGGMMGAAGAAMRSVASAFS